MTAADVPAPGLTEEEERRVSRPAVDLAADVREEAELEAALRARVQRVLARRIGAPAIMLAADLFQPGEGPLAPLLAAVREQADVIDKVRGLHTSDGAETPFCNECGHAYPCHTLRAVLPADHGREGR